MFHHHAAASASHALTHAHAICGQSLSHPYTWPLRQCHSERPPHARRQLAMPTRRTDTQIKACSEHLTHSPRQGSTNQSEAKYIGSVGLNKKEEN